MHGNKRKKSFKLILLVITLILIFTSLVGCYRAGRSPKGNTNIAENGGYQKLNETTPGNPNYSGLNPSGQNPSSYSPGGVQSPGLNPNGQNATDRFEQPNQNVKKEMVYSNASLGGIHLGDSRDKVIKTFGNTYLEENLDANNSKRFRENVSLITYKKGIKFVIGKATNQVLEIEVTSPNYKTGDNVKVGDNATAILKLYRSRFKEYKGPLSNQSNYLGWFNVENSVLLIFNFDNVTGSNRMNTTFTGKSQIKRMILTYTWAI